MPGRAGWVGADTIRGCMCRSDRDRGNDEGRKLRNSVEFHANVPDSNLNMGVLPHELLVPVPEQQSGIRDQCCPRCLPGNTHPGVKA